MSENSSIFFILRISETLFFRNLPNPIAPNPPKLPKTDVEISDSAWRSVASFVLVKSLYEFKIPVVFETAENMILG